MRRDWRNTAIIVAFGVALITTIATQPGPTWLWATDACPSSAVACGHPPIGLLVIAGVLFGANVLVERVGSQGGEA